MRQPLQLVIKGQKDGLSFHAYAYVLIHTNVTYQ